MQQQSTELFVVRVWREPQSEGSFEWRGRVQHMVSGETRYFRDWQALVTFLDAMLSDMQRQGGAAPLA